MRPRSRRARARSAGSGYAKNDTGSLASTSTRWRRPCSCATANSARYAEPLDRGQAGAAFEPGRERLAQQLGAGRRRDARRRDAARARASACPPSNSAAGSPLRNALTASSIASSVQPPHSRARDGRRARARRPPTTRRRRAGSASRHRPRRACVDRLGRVGARPSPAPFDSRTHRETLRATPTMSDASGASSAWWYVAWSPTMLTIGVRAAARVVQVREPVAEAGPEVQQRGRRAGSAMRP